MGGGLCDSLHIKSKSSMQFGILAYRVLRTERALHGMHPKMYRFMLNTYLQYKYCIDRN